jgi:hypothetical protein
MSSRRPFIRKLVYLLVIGALLIPLHWLGHPATSSSQGVKGRPGGKLAQLRNKYRLSPAQLGEIDPTSVTIKLATLGMRGVAANILWTKAFDYKMRKDWTSFGATLNQITRVQPNFLNVWVNQSWNLSYNISVEFDDYRERYRWVIKGFQFLNDGIKYNEGQPKLPWELGRYVSQKIGKADEVKQYRRLFAKDTDYRESLPADLRDAGLDYRGLLDNWLVGKGWYEKAVNLIESPECQGTMGQSRLIYSSSAPMCQMNYAEAMEKDGMFGERAKEAWKTASGEWSLNESSYGNKPMPSTTMLKDDRPVMVRLNDLEKEEAKSKEALAKLEEQIKQRQPKLREEMIAEKKALLTADQREALKTEAKKRNERQARLAAQAEEAIQITPEEIAGRLAGTPEQRKQAKGLAKQSREHEQLAAQIRGDRSIVNFDYWRQHSGTEQGPDVLDARSTIYKGDLAFAQGDLVGAYDNYEKGLKLWRIVLDAHPEYVTDQTTCEELVDMIKRYRHLLNQRDEPFPKKFPLQDVLDSYQKLTGETPMPMPAKQGDAKPSKPDAKRVDVKKADEKKVADKKAGVEKAEKKSGGS